MRKLIIITLMIQLSLAAKAYENYADGLFSEQPQRQVFATQSKLEQHIKSNLPSTYLYFERLSNTAKNRVFEYHLANNNKDLTEIILNEYRNRS